jgi:hypothetical protein
VSATDHRPCAENHALDPIESPKRQEDLRVIDKYPAEILADCVVILKEYVVILMAGA